MAIVQLCIAEKESTPKLSGLKPTKTICLAHESVIHTGLSMEGLVLFHTGACQGLGEYTSKMAH